MEEAQNKNHRYKNCTICSQLADKESAFRKFGNDDISTTLPDVSQNLAIVKDFRPLSERKIQLKQCPRCGTYYLYRTDYDYYVNGSEDEQELTRLTDSEASEYLNRAESL